FGLYWRRSGGRLSQASTESVAGRLAAQLERVGSWDEFLGARLALDPDVAIPEAERRVLDALPASVHLYGDRVPVDYEVGQGGGGGGPGGRGGPGGPGAALAGNFVESLWLHPVEATRTARNSS